MGETEASGPNAEQIRYWNEVSGPKWVAVHRLLDAQIGPLGERTMQRAAVARDERVLDVGCGCGTTTVELGRRVGPGGRVLGIDVSAVMLEVAHAAAASAELPQVSFTRTDAQTHAFEPESFDLLFSRFGVMFFAHPTDAFANLRRALRPGGRVAFVCWQEMTSNPWMSVPLLAALQHVPLPAPPPPDAPGPFAFADPARVRGILEGAGFAEVELESANERLAVGGGQTLEASVGLVMQLGPLGAALRDADQATRERVMRAVHDAVAPHWTPQGLVMDSAAWIVSARR